MERSGYSKGIRQLTVRLRWLLTLSYSFVIVYESSEIWQRRSQLPGFLLGVFTHFSPLQQFSFGALGYKILLILVILGVLGTLWVTVFQERLRLQPARGSKEGVLNENVWPPAPKDPKITERSL